MRLTTCNAKKKRKKKHSHESIYQFQATFNSHKSSLFRIKMVILSLYVLHIRKHCAALLLCRASHVCIHKSLAITILFNILWSGSMCLYDASNHQNFYSGSKYNTRVYEHQASKQAAETNTLDYRYNDAMMMTTMYDSRREKLFPA